MRRLPILTALSALALACATLETRIAESQEAFDTYPPEVQEQIRAGEIAVGFTPEQVLMALGEPSRRSQVTTDDAVAEVWIWRRSVAGAGFGLRSGGYHDGVGVQGGILVEEPSRLEDEMIVEFVNGRVSRFEKLIEEE